MKIVITGGGSGGHIFPAIAIAKYYYEKYDAKILYIGSEKGLEKDIVKDYEYIKFKTIKIAGLKRSFTPKAIKANFETFILYNKAKTKSLKYIKNFEPDFVISTGGYV